MKIINVKIKNAFLNPKIKSFKLRAKKFKKQFIKIWIDFIKNKRKTPTNFSLEK